MKIRFITKKQQLAEQEKERSRNAVAGDLMKLTGRLFTAAREALDYMRNNPPPNGSARMTEWDKYHDTMAKLNSLIYRTEP